MYSFYMSYKRPHVGFCVYINLSIYIYSFSLQMLAQIDMTGKHEFIIFITSLVNDIICQLRLNEMIITLFFVCILPDFNVD